MKRFVATLFVLLANFPSLGLTLTMEELVSVLSDEQVQGLEEVAPESIPVLLNIFPYVLEIADDKDRSGAIRRVTNFGASPEVLSIQQLLHRLEGYGVVLPQGEVNALYDFASDMELRYARQILATQAGIEGARAAIARLQEVNRVKENEISSLMDELDKLRATSAEARARAAELENEIARINREIVETQALIVDIEAMR